MRTKLLLLAAAVLALSACDKADKSASTAELGAGRYSISEKDQSLINQQFPGALASKTGLLSVVRQAGQAGGANPRHGAIVSVNYSLRLLDGRHLEASEPGEPLRFPVGVGRVIRGWDEALLQMTKGEKRTLIIPHYLAYGITGSPPKIPPYATLVFEVELVDFTK